MAGQEERMLRREKKLQKRRTARQSRSRVRQALLDHANSEAQEAATFDADIRPERSVGHVHVGRNKPRQQRRTDGTEAT